MIGYILLLLGILIIGGILLYHRDYIINTFKKHKKQIAAIGTGIAIVSAGGGSLLIPESNRPNVNTLIETSDGKFWSPTYNNLQTAIDSLSTSGGVITLPSTTIVLAGTLYINHTGITINGRGNCTTFDMTPGRIWIQANNITMRDFSVIGNCSASDANGLIHLERNDGENLQNFLFENIWAYGVTHSAEGSTYNWEGLIVIEAYDNIVGNMVVRNCHIKDSDGAGFKVQSWVSHPGKIENVSYEDCSAINAGRYSWNHTQNVWTGGFIIEWNCENIMYRNCRAVRCWESGFHMEAIDSDKIVYDGCISEDNGIDKAGSSTYASGFLVSDNVTMMGCYANGNYEAGIQFSTGPTNPLGNTLIMGNRVDGRGVTIQGISSAGNRVTGIVISDNTITDCSAYGMYFHHINASTISGNRILGATTGGIGIGTSKLSNNNTISTNFLNGCGAWGFHWYGNNNVFNGNVIRGCTYGIDLEAVCQNNSIIGNQILGCTDNIWIEVGAGFTLIDGNVLNIYSGEAIDDDSASTTTGDNIV